MTSTRWLIWMIATTFFPTVVFSHQAVTTSEAIEEREDESLGPYFMEPRKEGDQVELPEISLQLEQPILNRQPIVVLIRSDHFAHNNLLFEEPDLERQGKSRLGPLQLAESSFKFFSRSLALPVNFLLGRHRRPQH